MISIADALKQDILNAQNRLENWNKAQPHFQPILDSLEDFEFAYTPYWDGCLNLSFSGDRKKLARVWFVLRSAGFQLQPGWDRPQTGQSSWSGYFVKFIAGLWETQVWISFTSSVCRRVQVGEKTVVEPIWEVRCGESESESEETHEFL